MIILRCRTCRGKGEITNEQHLICESLKSHDAKRYFHIRMEDSAEVENEIEPDACNNVPETVPCPVCDGMGTIAFDDDDWDLQIVEEGEDVVS